MKDVIAVLLIIFFLGRAITWLVNPRYKTGETYRQLEAETSQAWGPVLNNVLMFGLFVAIALPALAVVAWLLSIIP